MNAKRDPDRMIQAWLDLMPDEAPDRAIAAVHQAVERTPQVRRSLGWALWRLPRMNRPILVAAAIVAVVGAGAFVLRPSSNVGPPATTSPSPASSPIPSPIGSPIAAPAAEALRSAWLADAAPIAGLGNTEPRLRLVVTPNGTGVSVSINAATKTTVTLSSQPVPGAPGELNLVALATATGCTAGDTGQYQTALSSDGVYLTLTLVADTCIARGATLGRTWVRAADAAGLGGQGLVAGFEPAFLVTLPSATYFADPPIPDSATVYSVRPDRTLIAVKNPAGYSDPCSADGGSKIQIAHTIAAFSAYLDTLPGLTVQSQVLDIDGKPAAHLTIPTTTTPDCPSGRVHEWTLGDVVTTGGWLIGQGVTDVVYLVEVDSDLYLLQWLGADVTPAEELSVLSTVHFVSGLPSPS